MYFTSKEVAKLINKSLDEDYNLHIFINSLNTIRSIVKLINTDNFRTICSKGAEKEDNKNGGKKVDIQNYNIIAKMFKSTISVMNNVNQTNKIKVKSDLLEIYTEIFNALPSL